MNKTYEDMLTGEQLYDRIDSLETELVEAREIIRKQGQFILSIKHEIRDFLVDG